MYKLILAFSISLVMLYLHSEYKEIKKRLFQLESFKIMIQEEREHQAEKLFSKEDEKDNV